MSDRINTNSAAKKTQKKTIIDSKPDKQPESSKQKLNPDKNSSILSVSKPIEESDQNHQTPIQKTIWDRLIDILKRPEASNNNDLKLENTNANLASVRKRPAGEVSQAINTDQIHVLHETDKSAIVTAEITDKVELKEEAKEANTKNDAAIEKTLQPPTESTTGQTTNISNNSNIWDKLTEIFKRPQAEAFFHHMSVRKSDIDHCKTVSVALNQHLWQQTVQESDVLKAKTNLASQAMHHYGIRETNNLESNFPYHNICCGPSLSGLLYVWHEMNHYFRVYYVTEVPPKPDQKTTKEPVNGESNESRFPDHPKKKNFTRKMIVQLYVNGKKCNVRSPCTFSNLAGLKEELARQYLNSHAVDYVKFLAQKQASEMQSLQLQIENGGKMNGENAVNSQNGQIAESAQNGVSLPSPIKKIRTVAGTGAGTKGALVCIGLEGNPVYNPETAPSEYTANNIVASFGGNISLANGGIALNKFCQITKMKADYEYSEKTVAGDQTSTKVAKITMYDHDIVGTGKSKKEAKNVAAEAMVLYLVSEGFYTEKPRDK